VYEFDVRSRRLQQTGERRPFAFPVGFSADGTTVLLRDRGAIIAADSRTLAERFTIPGNARDAIVLSSGGVAALDISGGNGTVRVFDVHGTHLRDIALRHALDGGVREIVPGKKLLATIRFDGGLIDSSSRNRDSYVIDLERGAIERREHEMQVLWGGRQT